MNIVTALTDTLLHSNAQSDAHLMTKSLETGRITVALQCDVRTDPSSHPYEQEIVQIAALHYDEVQVTQKDASAEMLLIPVMKTTVHLLLVSRV